MSFAKPKHKFINRKKTMKTYCNGVKSSTKKMLTNYEHLYALNDKINNNHTKNLIICSFDVFLEIYDKIIFD